MNVDRLREIDIQDEKRVTAVRADCLVAGSIACLVIRAIYVGVPRFVGASVLPVGEQVVECAYSSCCRVPDTVTNCDTTWLLK